jgi:hypothetical protein
MTVMDDLAPAMIPLVTVFTVFAVTLATMVMAIASAVMRPAGGRQRNKGSHKRKQRHLSHDFHLAGLDCPCANGILSGEDRRAARRHEQDGFTSAAMKRCGGG